MKAANAAAPAAHSPDSDSPSLADLHPLALGALARALQSDDERIALRAAQVVVQHLYRNLPPPTVQKEKVILLQYGDNPPFRPTPRTANGAGQPRALQSGGVRETLGQDDDGSARRNSDGT